MKVLVLELCRMGDIVQCFPMLLALVRDGARPELVIREGFQDLPVPKALASAVHYLPTLEPEPKSKAECIHRIERLAPFLISLRKQRFDLVINLSHDLTSAWIAHYLQPEAVRGMVAGPDRKIRYQDPWTQYLLCLPENRNLGGINLAEVCGHVAGVPLALEEPLPKEPLIASSESWREKARALLRDRGAVGRALIGLVPGASDARKRWPAQNFAKAGAALQRADCGVVILGTGSERERAETVCRLSEAPLLNLAGDTTLPLLAAVLQELDLVITNDTGTMHLAAAVGTRTLTIALGPSHVYDSGPYGAAHVTLEPELHCSPCHFASSCRDPVCHQLIVPKTVVEWALSMLFHHELPSRGDESYRAYRSELDGTGRLTLRPLIRYPLQAEDFIRMVYRELWESSLPVRENALRGQSVASRIRDQWDVSLSAHELERARAAAASAERLSIRLESSCAELLLACRGSDSESPETAGALEQLSREIELAGRLDPLIRPLTALCLLQLRQAGIRFRARVLTDLLTCLSTAANRARLFQGIVRTALDEPELCRAARRSLPTATTSERMASTR